MTHQPRHFSINRFHTGKRGSALLVILAFLLLLTTITIAFLGRATLERLLSGASLNQNKVDIVGQGAISTILADLQQEVVAGSNGTGTPSLASGFYYPTSPLAAVPCPMVPVDTGATGTSPAVTVTASLAPTVGMENLLKESYYNTPFYTSIGSGTYYATTPAAPVRGSSVSTATPSLNNRSVSAARWNKPLLLAKEFPASTSTLTPVTNFVVPNWVYVARDGSNPGATSTTFSNSYIYSANISPLSTPSSATPFSNAVTQRFAYAIYDEGGTLDLNVAGNPMYGSGGSGTYSPLAPYKSALSYADLTQLPYLGTTAWTVSNGSGGTTTSGVITAAQAQTIVNAIVGWRNNASGSGTYTTPLISGSFPAYTFATAGTGTINPFDAYVQGTGNGFMTAAGTSIVSTTGQTDSAFGSRQQLIQFLLQGVGNSSATSPNAYLSNLQNALPYLGTFSRDINQPSYAPDPNRPVVLATTSGGNDMAGQSYSASGQNVINPSFLSVTATSTFSRNDGSLATVGEPLVKRRFALNRLAWLTYLGPITSTTSPRTSSSLTSPSSTLFTNGNSNTDYDIYLLENTYGFPVSFLKQGNAANIYKYFGLSWVNDSRPTGISGTGDSQMKWVYNHTQANPASGATTSPITSMPSHPGSPTSSTRIWTLSQVAAAGREPDFFELLKAAVSAGALGKPCSFAAGQGSGVNASTAGSPSDYQNLKDTSLDAQVIQLGANIIAQYQPCGVPPRILFDDGIWSQAQEYRGVEDLPYFYSSAGAITRLKDTVPTFTSAAGPNSGTPNQVVSPTVSLTDPGVGAMFQTVSIWNPHALNANATSSTASNVAAYAANIGPRPTKFRIFAIGGTPNMTSPPTTSDPNAITPEAACKYASGPSGSGVSNDTQYVCTPSTAQTYNTALEQSVSLNSPESGQPDTSLTFSIPCGYSGSGAATTTWRPDLFREPTLLCKPNVPTGSNLSFGPNNLVLNAPYKTLLATQITNGTVSGGAIGLEDSMGDTAPAYSSVGVTDNNSTTGKAAYLGIFMGVFPLSWINSSNYIISAGYAVATTNLNSQQITYRIECQDPATGNWEVYDEKYTSPSIYGWGTNSDDVSTSGHATLTAEQLSDAIVGDELKHFYIDPRTSRFASFSNDPNLGTYTNQGVWAWPLHARNFVSNSGSLYLSFWTTGWAAPTNAAASGAGSAAYNAASQNAIWTYRPDEETGWAIGYLNHWTTPPFALGWFRGAGGAGDGQWRPGSMSQNNAASSFHDSANKFGFLQDAFGSPASAQGGFYADPDGVVRRATAGYLQPSTTASGAPIADTSPAPQRPSGNPSGVPTGWTYTYAATTATIPGQATQATTADKFSNNLPSRPIVLNRPFRSVGELGNAFSGTPWRNVDFFTPESGYSALLDVFCINDTNDPSGLVAGKINLNTRQAASLKAVLAGAYQDDQNPTTATIAASGSSSAATADNIAKALVARTTDSADVSSGSGPLRNVSELVGKYVSSVAAANATGAYDGAQSWSGFSGAPTTANGTPPASTPANLSSVLYGDTTSSNYYAAANIQRYREATTRALSAAGTSRVWNLMIDVIAQSGRFPNTATSFANFNVEGERRYWVHVAIDRFTGKVLDQQIEEVKE